MRRTRQLDIRRMLCTKIVSTTGPETTSARVFHPLKRVLHGGQYMITGYKQRVLGFTAGHGSVYPQALPQAQLSLPSADSSIWELPAFVWDNVKRTLAHQDKTPAAIHSITIRPSPFSKYVKYNIYFTFVRLPGGKLQVSTQTAYKQGLLPQVAYWSKALWLSCETGMPSLDFREVDMITDRIARDQIDIVASNVLHLPTIASILSQSDAIQVSTIDDLILALLEVSREKKLPWKYESAGLALFDSATGYRVQSHLSGNSLGRPFNKTGKTHRVIVAFGSNLGDRVQNVEMAIREMRKRNLVVTTASFLYETEAMYYEDQGAFINGVCEVQTGLNPLDLLDVLQEIEALLGRERVIDKGPRTIDLDILLYDFETISHSRLDVPHKLMVEREFVLRPLADVIPSERLPPPHSFRSIMSHLANIEAAAQGKRPVTVSICASNKNLMKPNDPQRKTQIMAILNITPDSFSDGGKHSASDLDTVEDTVRAFISEGATIIDVGGQSTRPNATQISSQEELERVCPVIKRIRAMPEGQNIAISIDTFYAKVARGAIEAGADIINDVSGGTLDVDMLPLVAEMQKSIVLMHMRGTPQTMTEMTHYPRGVIRGVIDELLERVEAAKAAGIHPWRIILDPGIGFAKTQTQNLELLRNLGVLRDQPCFANLPWLVGASRKGFIGKITQSPTAGERSWGTAAAVTASIAGGADIVRVHDVFEMARVVKMADAVYRTSQNVECGDIQAAVTTEIDAKGTTNGNRHYQPTHTHFANAPDTVEDEEFWKLSDGVLRTLKDLVESPSTVSGVDVDRHTRNEIIGSERSKMSSSTST